MDKVRAVIRREYLARVRSRWFIVSTLLAPLLLVGVMALPLLLTARQAERVLEVSVVDATGEFTRELLRTEPFDSGRFRYVPPPSGDPERVSGELRQRVLNRKLAGYVRVPADVVDSARIEYWGWEGASPTVTDPLRVAANTALTRLQARRMNIDYVEAERLTRGVTIDAYRVTGAGAAREEEKTVLAAHILGILIYFVVLLYGAMMLRAAVAEKTSRTVEIVLSSVRPGELMLGKILGVGAVGLTQLAIWGGLVVLLLIYAGSSPALAEAGLLNDLPLGSDTLLLFLGLFLTGYFLYAGLYASAGAIASNEQEASQLQIPITVLLIVPILVIPVILESPAGDAARLLSWFPLFTPILFLVRYVLGATSLWEVPFIFSLQVVGILAIAWIGGRIYRVGLLLTGKRPSVPELLRWIRHG